MYSLTEKQANDYLKQQAAERARWAAVLARPVTPNRK